MKYMRFADISLQGGLLSREECMQVLCAPDRDILTLLDAAYRVRHKYFGNTVQIQVLTNAKSGLCQEDCHYCSQSRISKAKIDKYPLISEEKLVSEALRAKDLDAKRFCMALSGRKPTDTEIDSLCAVIAEIKNETGISTCCSIGLIDGDQAKKLKAAGLNRVNHNLNTSEKYHSHICTTHTYQDRINTISLCRATGLEICSGGIIGQGESDEDIIDLLLALREINPDSIPLNFLIPIKGTPLGGLVQNLTPRRCLKVVCLARFLIPDRELRVAGGREQHIRTLQPMALYAVNSIFVKGYLTTSGQPADEAIQMIADLGFEVEVEGAG
jgi:biotin synthase